MPAGRPRKYQDLKALQKLIDDYFADCEIREIPLTITGLALALDTSRKRLLDIENNYPADFRHAIKKAKLIVENDYEKALRKNGRAGEIFGLKNFGWKDQQDLKVDKEIKHSVSEDLLEAISDITGKK